MKKLTYNQINIVLLTISWIVFLYLGSHFLLYNDDMATMLEVRMPFGEMLRFLSVEDIHLPVYFILLKMWLFVFGDSIFAARCFSYVGVLAGAFVAGGMIKKLYGEKAGFWYTVLVLFLPVSFSLALTIRMYSWVSFFCAASFLSARLALSEGTKKYFVFYLIYAFLGAWTHYYGTLTCALIAVSFLLQSWKKDKELFKKCFIYNAVLFLLVCPEIYILLQQNIEGVGWIKKEYVMDAWREFFFDYNQNAFFQKLPAFMMYFLWIVGFQFLLNEENTDQKRTSKAAVFIALGVWGIPFAISFVYSPFLVGRYLDVVYGCSVIFFTFGVFNNRGNKILLTVLLLLSFYPAIYPHKMRLEISVQPLFYQMFQQNVAADDVVVVEDWQLVYWLYYHFPNHDVRILKGTEQQFFKKKQRLIEENEIRELATEKNVFLTTAGNFHLNAANIFSAYDAYLTIPLRLKKLVKSEN